MEDAAHNKDIYGFSTFKKRNIPLLKFLHAFLHCHSLATKTFYPNGEEILTLV